MPSAAAGIPVNTTMLASVSDPLALVVNSEAIQYYPTSPLPNEYWTRPVNGQLRSWSQVMGSSWEDNKYNEAPESPHVLWTKPLTIGGLVGGSLGEVGSGGTSVAFENGDAYEGKWSNRLILAGRLYYVSGAYDRPTVTYCVDLRTGEELWSKVFLANATISPVDDGDLLLADSFS
jgi:outer membrane protein assembly factor BamB